jgi:hypothetical protein
MGSIRPRWVPGRWGIGSAHLSAASRCQEQRPEAVLEVGDYGRQVQVERGKRTAPQKRPPLGLLDPILEKLGCERHGHFLRQRNVAPVEGCPDRIAQKLVVDIHVRENHMHVVEILQPAVQSAKDHSGIELLCYDRRGVVGAKPRRGVIQNSRILDQFRSGSQSIAKADIDLERQAGTPQEPDQPNANTMVLLVVANVIGLNGGWVEANTIIIYLGGDA